MLSPSASSLSPSSTTQHGEGHSQINWKIPAHCLCLLEYECSAPWTQQKGIGPFLSKPSVHWLTPRPTENRSATHKLYVLLPFRSPRREGKASQEAAWLEFSAPLDSYLISQSHPHPQTPARSEQVTRKDYMGALEPGGDLSLCSFWCHATLKVKSYTVYKIKRIQTAGALQFLLDSCLLDSGLITLISFFKKMFFSVLIYSFH